MNDVTKNTISLDSKSSTASETRFNLLYEIGLVLSSLETLNEAAPRILEAICRNLQFELGEFWCLGEKENILRLKSVWHLPLPALEKFTAASRQFEFPAGEGLPGKVWAQNAPVWIENLSGEANMPRRFFSEEVNLKSGFAFPLFLGEKFFGAFSFFSSDTRRADETLLQAFAAVGSSIGQFAKREKVENYLRESEDRYRAFIEQSTEGIWRFELDEEFSVNLPVDEQVELAFERGYLAECNDAMARMYGLTKAEELVGSRIADLLDMTDAANVEYLRSFIESGYNLTDAESHEKDVDGNDKYFLNSLVGTVENENLIRVWGTQRDITEQKYTEQSLTDNEERYRALVEATSTVVWRANERGELNFVGSSWEEVSGQRVEEILGAGWLDALHPDDRENTIRVWQNALAAKTLYETEFRVLTVSGEYRWFAVRGVPILNSDGSLREWVGANTDIHQRKLAEQAVRESEESYRIVAETASDVVIKINENSQILFVNSAVERVFGHTVEEMVGESLAMIMPEHLRERHHVGLRRYLETGERRLPWESMEIPARHKDGHTFPLEVSFGEYHENGRRFFIGIARDISERKQAEEKLRESEARFVKAFKASPLALIISSLETGKLLDVNETFLETTGYTRGETIGRTSVELGLWNSLADRTEELGTLQKTGRVRNAEYRFNTRYGTEIVGLLSAERIEIGGESFALSVIQDISDRKRAEEVLLERERLALLNSEISEALIKNDSLPDILRSCTDAIVKHLDAAFARIWTLDKTENILELRASSGIYTHLDGDHSRVPVGKYKIGWIAETRKPHLTNQVVGDERVGNQEWATREKMVAFAGYPLIVEDHLVGVVAMFARQPLSERTLGVLAAVANTIALGIERKQSESAVRESEAEFRRLANAVPQIVWVAGAGGTLEYVNEQWTEFSGLTLEETGRREIVAEVIYPDDREAVFGEWAKAFAVGEPYRIEARMRKHSTDEFCWFLMQSVPAKDADGKILKWFGTSTDITENKQAENRLALFAEISELTRTFEDPNQLLAKVSQAVGEHLKVRRCLFNEIDFEQDRETVHLDYCRGVPSVAGVHRISDYSSITSADMIAGRTVVNSDSKADSRTAKTYAKTYAPNGERAYIAVPLLRENRWVASLWVSTDEPREWSRQEVSMLETIAERTWTAIEKMRIDAALRASEHHLQLAIDISRISTFEIDLKTDAVETDAVGRAIYGFKSDEPLTFEMIQARLHPDDKDEVLSRVAAAFASEGTGEFEVEQRIIRTDGETRWIRVLGRAFFETSSDGERQAVRCLGTYVDITSNKHAEEKLRESDAILQTINRNSPTLIYLKDRNGRMLTANPATLEVLGKPLVEVLGKTHGEYTGKEAEGAAIAENDRQIIEGGKTETFEETVLTAGEPHAFLSTKTPYRNQAGEIIGLVGVSFDITDRKKAEIERERLFAEAEAARKIAEDANYAKDEFIALVSHELRSPLNAMLGWTRILQNQNPDEKTKEYALDVIVRNARSQSRLIEDLLDIARVSRGKLRLEMEPTELIPIINQAIEIIEPAAEAGNITITQSLDRAADFITGDIDRLRQVIDNLLSNAVKFTASGDSVEIRLERENTQAKIMVSDTGQGISPEFLPQIFERFKQADHSTTRRHGGLGIGLSLARDLVELHGGTILAESAGEGKGSTFTVMLPLRMILPFRETSDKVEFMDSHGKLSGFWILAVDDEADARELVSFMLQINGAKVTTANSAVEALDILKSAEGRLPDILLSDISMPNESGYALLEKVRALPQEHGGQIPAVALTAFNRPEDREAAYEAGFQKHLGKPVEPDDLISAIIETAGNKQSV